MEIFFDCLNLRHSIKASRYFSDWIKHSPSRYNFSKVFHSFYVIVSFVVAFALAKLTHPPFSLTTSSVVVTLCAHPNHRVEQHQRDSDNDDGRRAARDSRIDIAKFSRFIFSYSALRDIVIARRDDENF